MTPTNSDESKDLSVFDQVLRMHFCNDEKSTSLKDAKRSNHHKLIVTSTGARFGFKTWSGAVAADGSPSDCAERDRCFYKIARCVAAPNVCKMAHLPNLKYSGFEDQPVVVSEWLPNAESFDHLTQENIERIRKDGGSFFRQYGEWIALGTCLQFRDWTPNNFVWSESESALTMIDFDWSFGCGLRQESDYTCPLHAFRPIPEDRMSRYLEHLGLGVQNMQEKLETRHGEIKDILSRSSLQVIQDFNLEIDSDLSTTASKLIRNSLM